MQFTHYVQPATAAEALDWAQKPNTVILGGMMWLHLQKRTVENAVDLSLLGLDKIDKTENGIRIGAYVTLREIETSPLLLAYTHGAVASALSPIVGVQFRNTATVGGSVFGRFGFSDVSTLFCALGAEVELAGKGRMPMADFIRDGASHDVLLSVLLPKEAPEAFAVLAHRNTATDFPVVTLALAKRGERIRLTVSPAPVRGQTLEFGTADAKDAVETCMAQLKFGANGAASAEYRTHLARVLISRGLQSIGG